MKQNVIIIDQGSHSSRALAFDYQGNVLDTCSVAIKTSTIQTDCLAQAYIEQSPDEILASVIEALGTLAKMLLPEQINNVSSVALIVQRSSLLACRKDSLQPLTPIISWQDTRNQALVRQLLPRLQQIKKATGLRINAHYGASKMRWLLENNAAVQQAQQDANLLFVPLAAFIAAKLVGACECVVDPVIASRTLLSQLGECAWSPEMLKLFAIDDHCLPRIVPSDYLVGHIEFAGRTIPLNLVGGDQSFVAFAFGLPVDADVAYINVGTGAFVQMLDKSNGSAESDLLKSPLVITGKDKIIVMEGTVNAAATALDWLWQTAGQQLDYDAIDQAMLAGHQQPLFINTIAGTGSPYWLPAQPPCFIDQGFIGEVSLLDKAVAVLESIVFALMDNLQRLRSQNPQLAAIMIGGGLAQFDGFCQKLANLSGLKVTRPKMHEISARGAAFYLLQKQRAEIDDEQDYFVADNDAALQQRYEQYTQVIKSLLNRI